MGRKRKIVHSGVVAEVEEEDLDEMRMVDKRKKKQTQPPPEKYWTASCFEAENLVNKGVKLIAVLSSFDNLPKRWVFDDTKENIANLT